MKVGSRRSTGVTKLLQKQRRHSCNGIGLCRILSTGKTSVYRGFEEPTGSEIRRYHPGNFFSISWCVAIAIKNLTRRRRRKNCDASTYQSNNFGVSRKRFKPSTPGSRSAKVIDLGVNRKHICDFLLVIIVTNVSPTVFETLTFKARKWLVSPPLSCLTPPLCGDPFEFRDETYPAKTRGMGLPYSENFILLTATVSDWSSRVTDRQTDRQTDNGI